MNTEILENIRTLKRRCPSFPDERYFASCFETRGGEIPN